MVSQDLLVIRDRAVHLVNLVKTEPLVCKDPLDQLVLWVNQEPKDHREVQDHKDLQEPRVSKGLQGLQGLGVSSALLVLLVSLVHLVLLDLRERQDSQVRQDLKVSRVPQGP